jgi:methyl-accepting chemotaxis protein
MTPNMTLPPGRRDERVPPPEAAAGLRLRIWFGCMGGALVAAAGMWWVIAGNADPTGVVDLPLFVLWVSAVSTAGILIGIALALWLDRGIIGHLNGISSSLASGRVSDLRSLPAGAGWGVLSQITQQVQNLLTHHRQAARAAEELALVRAQLAMMRESLDRWVETERWGGLHMKPGALTPLVDTLDRGLRHLDDVRGENREAVRQIGAAVERALGDARETASEAERGFVEATALLTTVRELQRLGGELEQSIATLTSTARGPDAEALGPWREATRAAIQELLDSSSGSVEHLGRGLLRVQEISDQVHLVANRATLIALNSALAGSRMGRPEAEMAELSEEMKRLAAEVRVATERTSRLSQDVEGEVASAVERMRGVRERVAERLERIPLPAPGEMPRLGERSRLLERVREMIQDAGQKGERLSAAGESVSRAAERLVRRLEEEVHELEGMVVRLSPPELPSAPTSGSGPSEGTAGPETAVEGTSDVEPGTRTPGLRLLGQEHLLPGDPPRGVGRRTAGDHTMGHEERE